MRTLTSAGFVGLGVIIGSSAFAADMAVKAPPPVPVAPVATWTGCYVGGNVGAAWTRQSQNRIDQIELSGAIFPTSEPYGAGTNSGVVGGAQLGCDYQFASSWVIGAQGQFDWTNLGGYHPSGFPFGTFSMDDRTKNFDTLTGRLGYTFQSNLLAYVKGGGAWVRNTDALYGIDFLSESATWTATGWTVGAGLEYRVSPNWSLFAEYNYLGFGTKTIQFIAPPGLSALGEHVAVNQNVQNVLVGLNYRFNWWGGKAPPALVTK